VRAYISAALKETREYGLDIYFARVSATVALRLDHPVIAFFLGRASSDLTPVALYNVPQRLGNPIATMSRALAVTRFRAFTRIGRVSKRISRWNLAILVAASAGLVVVGPWVIKLFFPRYVETIPLLLPFAVLNLFAGLFQPYNMFLTSRGYAREVRNIAIAVAVGNLTGLIIGVRFFGIIGAAWAGAASMALDYALHLYYYRKLTRVEVTPHELAAGPAQKQ
jgi:O-antigen/teichoic acid export membrane protein